MFNSSATNMTEEIWTEAAIWRANNLWPLVFFFVAAMPMAALFLFSLAGMESLAHRTKNQSFLLFSYLVAVAGVTFAATAINRAMFGASINVLGFTVPILPTLLPPTCELAEKYDTDMFMCRAEHFQTFLSNLMHPEKWNLLLTLDNATLVGGSLCLIVLPLLLLGYFSMGAPLIDIVCIGCGERETIHDVEGTEDDLEQLDRSLQARRTRETQADMYQAEKGEPTHTKSHCPCRCHALWTMQRRRCKLVETSPRYADCDAAHRFHAG